MKNEMREESKNTTTGKVLKGVVVSDKMDKTIVVRVDRLKDHPKYKKKFKISKRYKAHDEENKFKEGNAVEIAESRALSRDKRWVAREIAK